MLNVSKSKIREIAQELESGLRCFYHTETGEVHGYPDFDLNPIYDNEFWQEISDELEANSDKYLEIKNLPSRNHFEVIMDFAEQVPDKKIQ